MKGFKNVKAYVFNKGIIKTNIGFKNGKIVYIGNDSSKITEPIQINKNETVFPGFIDEHIHGAGGCDSLDGKFESLYTISTNIAKEGVTGYLPTPMTQSEEKITNSLKSIYEYIKKDVKEGAKVLGSHVEGPFINPIHCGAQPKEYIIKPDIETFDRYYKASGKTIKIMTIAPEMENAYILSKHLKKLGVVASVGHSDAKYDDMEKALDNGFTNVTHTYNAQKGIHHREVGTVGSALLFDEFNCEAICDTIHVSVPALKLIFKNKQKDKVTLITDAMRAKGLGNCISEIGGQKVIVKDGEARLENGALAGSVLNMNIAIKNVVEKCGVPLTTAIDYASINPAKNLKLDKSMGSISLNKCANFAVLDKDFNVKLTIRDGNIIYKA